MAAKTRSSTLEVLQPNLQISFYYRLQTLRNTYLIESLRATVKSLDLKVIDQQLREFVQRDALKKVASFGLRGELFFAIPCVLRANPFLLGYYRLLFGLSQKEFYNKGPFGKYKRLEDHGELPTRLADGVGPLCNSLAKTAEALVDALDELSLPIVHDLQLLTLGPQLRGGENTRIGQDATREVFSLIEKAMSSYIKETTTRTMRVKNDSGRTVMIEFFSDPDVRITQKLASGVRPLVSMEIKGGADASNIHNRLGEAEKSHQKAKNLGFFEFWTIVRVEIDIEKARRESPTTTHFFHLDRMKKPGSSENRRFKEHLASLVGIRAVR